jgi:putative ABC transport system permease protein
VTLSYVLLQNLRRNPLRTGLTGVAFALPMAIFVLAISTVVMLTKTAARIEQQLRLAVHHKAGLTVFMPEGMRQKIEELDPDRQRLDAVCGMRWFGGRIPDTPTALMSLACDVDTFPTVYQDVSMNAAEVEQWRNERRAALAGDGVAAQYGWMPGSRVVLDTTIPPYLRLEFIVVKIIPNASPPNTFYLRRDYLAESLQAQGFAGTGCNVFWVRCRSAAALHSLQKDIDARFANSPDETRSEDENAFVAGFIQALGDIPGLARAMALVVVCIIALVAGNTMMMSFRERVHELAVFKAIGFQSGRVFLIVLSESLLLALLGSLAGIALGAGFLLVPREQLRSASFALPEVSWLSVLGSLLIGLAVGLAAGLWPAYQAVRLRTTDALRRVA